MVTQKRQRERTRSICRRYPTSVYEWHEVKSILPGNHYDIQIHITNKRNVTQRAKQEMEASEGKLKAGRMAANKGSSKRGRKTGRYAKGFSMFNFQIGLSRMTFS